MKTKLILSALAALVLGVAALGVTGCKKETAPTESGGQTVKYTCSMHPDVIKDAPGKCPKCGMALEEKK